MNSDLVASVVIEVSGSLESIEPKLTVAFVPNPRNYERQIEDLEFQIDSPQLSLESKDDLKEKIEDVKEEYAKRLRFVPAVETEAVVVQYNRKNNKLKLSIPYSKFIDLMQASDILAEDAGAIVFVS